MFLSWSVHRETSTCNKLTRVVLPDGRYLGWGLCSLCSLVSSLGVSSTSFIILKALCLLSSKFWLWFLFLVGFRVQDLCLVNSGWSACRNGEWALHDWIPVLCKERVQELPNIFSLESWMTAYGGKSWIKQGLFPLKITEFLCYLLCICAPDISPTFSPSRWSVVTVLSWSLLQCCQAGLISPAWLMAL